MPKKIEPTRRQREFIERAWRGTRAGPRRISERTPRWGQQRVSIQSVKAVGAALEAAEMKRPRGVGGGSRLSPRQLRFLDKALALTNAGQADIARRATTMGPANVSMRMVSHRLKRLQEKAAAEGKPFSRPPAAEKRSHGVSMEMRRRVAELEAQGVPRGIARQMLGLSLETYYKLLPPGAPLRSLKATPEQEDFVYWALQTRKPNLAVIAEVAGGLGGARGRQWVRARRRQFADAGLVEYVGRSPARGRRARERAERIARYIQWSRAFPSDSLAWANALKRIKAFLRMSGLVSPNVLTLTGRQSRKAQAINGGKAREGTRRARLRNLLNAARSMRVREALILSLFQGHGEKQLMQEMNLPSRRAAHRLRGAALALVARDKSFLELVAASPYP